MNLYEKTFNEDVKDKKITAVGVHSRTGKRGYTGKILFPSDYLTGASKKEYQGTSKVRISSVYDQIIKYEGFKKLSKKDKKKHLVEYTKRFTNAEICEAFGITKGTLYYLRRQYMDVSERVNTNEKKQETKQPVFNANGLALSLAGSFTGSDIAKRLDKLSLLMNEEDTYIVRIELMESVK